MQTTKFKKNRTLTSSAKAEIIKKLDKCEKFINFAEEYVVGRDTI
jgi:hypothetical protein